MKQATDGAVAWLMNNRSDALRDGRDPLTANFRVGASRRVKVPMQNGQGGDDARDHHGACVSRSLDRS
jgi:hypothetical protein